MNITVLWTIAIGIAIGSIAHLLDRGVQRLGLILSVLVAIGAALGATYGGHLFGLYRPGQPGAFLGALIGAAVMMFLVRISQPAAAR